jgi:hypothetical protein
MPSSRLTSEQLAEITARKGYAIQANAPSSKCISSQGGDTDSLPQLECDLGFGPLAKEQVKEKSAGRFLVRCQIFRKRIIDPDNVSVKYAIDALRFSGILPDDRASDIKLEIAEQIKVAKDEEERIEIEVFGPDSVEAKQANQK